MGVLDDVRQAAAEAEAAEAENAQQSGSESSTDSEATTTTSPTTPTLTDVPTPKAEADPFAHTWETERFEADSDTLHEMSGLVIALGNLI
jgi:hypothetical protein